MRVQNLPAFHRLSPSSLTLLQFLDGLATVLRYAVRAAFIAALVIGVVGCGSGNSGGSSGGNSSGSGGNTSSTGTVSTSAAENIYVVQIASNGVGTILEFPATASGSTSPTATITPGLPLEQVNTDQDGNIYIVTYQDIREYAAGATGTATPTRTLSIPTGAIDGMAVSPAGEILIGEDGGDIDEWSATQVGNVAPERTIPGYSQIANSLSPVIVANQVAIDGSDNLYVAPEGAPPIPPAVVIYGPTANGNVAPTRTVGGTGIVYGVTVDSAGNVYTAGEVSCTFTTGPTFSETCTGIISEYAASATANTPPIRTISGSATQLASLSGIKVDAAGNIYVVSIANPLATPESPAVLKFSATASGNVAPTSSFTSTAWTTPDFNPSLALH